MGTDAKALHCPNCGAPANPQDGTCKYCHAQLATVSCPSCFALVFQGAAYCPLCGARLARAVGGTRSAPCPACLVRKGIMREVLVSETDMLECDTCHAVWVEAATFERICADKATQAAVLHQWPTPPVQQPAEIHYRHCVACGKIMNRMNFGRSSGTVVDVCKGHGTLLDPGELHQIVAFIQSGGLDRARDRQIEDMKEAEAQLRAAQNAQAAHQFSTGDMSITWPPGTYQGSSLLDLLKRLKATDD